MITGAEPESQRGQRLGIAPARFVHAQPVVAVFEGRLGISQIDGAAHCQRAELTRFNGARAAKHLCDIETDAQDTLI